MRYEGITTWGGWSVFCVGVVFAFGIGVITKEAIHDCTATLEERVAAVNPEVFSASNQTLREAIEQSVESEAILVEARAILDEAKRLYKLSIQIVETGQLPDQIQENAPPGEPDGAFSLS